MDHNQISNSSTSPFLYILGLHRGRGRPALLVLYLIFIKNNKKSLATLSCSSIGKTPSHMTSSRFGFGLGPGSTTVYGWPKKGGIYVLNGCVGINLEFLGYDRLGEETDLRKEMRLKNEQEEEAHCNKSKLSQKNKENFFHAHLGNLCSASARGYMVGKLPCSRSWINKRWRKIR
jgi:hypothetical protein